MKKFFTLLTLSALCAGAWAEELTVADGTATESCLPVCGAYYDYWGLYTHMIYPAEMLSEMEGADITAVTFYATEAIGFGGGTETLDVKVVNETSINDKVTDGLTRVFTGTIVPDGDKMTVTFDEPFTYEGGNLLLSFTWDGSGRYDLTYFLGIEATGASVFLGFSDQTLYDFLPKATFVFRNAEAPAEPVITVTPDFGTYEAAQTVMVSVENQPEGSKVMYSFVKAEGENAPRRLEGDMWQQYDAETGILVDRSGLLTIALVDANEEEITSIEGEYVIDNVTGIATVAAGKTVAAVRYYNAAGQAADKAFNGLNIVVTTYTDGSQAVAKVVK